MTTEEFIQKAKKVHGNKYDYSKVEYINSYTKVCIGCPEHGEFWQTPNAHLRQQNCPKCVGLYKPTTDEWIDKAREIHGNKYDYSKVNYINNHTKVCIICPEHGEFWQTPSMHLKGQGCPKCYGNITSDTEEFIEKARKVHGNKFDYSKVEYVNNHTKVCIICPEHGEFWQKPNSHLGGNGCNKCSYSKSVRSPRKTTECFIDESIKIHGNKYDYSKVKYTNNKTPVCIVCHEKDEYGNEHGEFWQKPNNHLNGECCPKCKHRTSKLEKKVETFLNENKILYEKEKRFDWLGLQRLDFYLPDYNIAIECQGEQHFNGFNFKDNQKNNRNNLDKIKEKDNIKKDLCKQYDIKLLYFTNNWIVKKYHCDECIVDLETLKLKIYGKEKCESANLY